MSNIGATELLSDRVKVSEKRSPTDDLREPPRLEMKSGLYPPPFLKPSLSEEDKEEFKRWEQWAEMTKMPTELLDMFDSTIQIITMIIDRAHLSIKTERLTPLIRQLVDYMKPALPSFNPKNLTEEGLKKTFWLYNFYGPVMKKEEFQVPKLLKTWLRMRSRRSRYENLTTLAYALR